MPAVPPVLVADGAPHIPNTILIDFQRPDPVGMAGVVQSAQGSIHGKQVWVSYGYARAALEYLAQRYQANQYVVTDAAFEVLNRLGVLGDVGVREEPPPPREEQREERREEPRKRKRWRRSQSAHAEPGDLDRGEAYRRLHLLPSAPPEVIKAAWVALAKIHHPDRGGNVERMQAINEAWAKLKS